ncbi:hypothetical protein HYDPIDRAFT_165942 [Hydnomerulius pinastri MD-312]|nr:hypothetical protein HYDPIDRAFT_165942 [Hydnomerulius pinastri MD-312]
MGDVRALFHSLKMIEKWEGARDKNIMHSDEHTMHSGHRCRAMERHITNSHRQVRVEYIISSNSIVHQNHIKNGKEMCKFVCSPLRTASSNVLTPWETAGSITSSAIYGFGDEEEDEYISTQYLQAGFGTEKHSAAKGTLQERFYKSFSDLQPSKEIKSMDVTFGLWKAGERS